MITKVVGLVLGVHEPEGVVVDELLPPHERTAATADAPTRPPQTILILRMRCFL